MSSMRDSVCERCVFGRGTHADWCPILKDQETFRRAVELIAKSDPVFAGMRR